MHEDMLGSLADALNGQIASAKIRLDAGESRQEFRSASVEEPQKAAKLVAAELLTVRAELEPHREKLEELLADPKCSRRDLMDLLRLVHKAT